MLLLLLLLSGFTSAFGETRRGHAQRREPSGTQPTCGAATARRDVARDSGASGHEILGCILVGWSDARATMGAAEVERRNASMLGSAPWRSRSTTLALNPCRSDFSLSSQMRSDAHFWQFELDATANLATSLSNPPTNKRSCIARHRHAGRTRARGTRACFHPTQSSVHARHQLPTTDERRRAQKTITHTHDNTRSAEAGRSPRLLQEGYIENAKLQLR